MYNAVYSRSVDTLELELATFSGSERIDVLIELSDSYLYQHPHKSIEFASEAFELALKSKDPNRQGLALFQLAYAYRIQGDNILHRRSRGVLYNWHIHT